MYIRTKSSWQKDDCFICHKMKCKFELVYEDSNIRFCGNLDCLDKIRSLMTEVYKLKNGETNAKKVSS